MQLPVPINYQKIVTILKSKIRAARSQAAVRLNADMLTIYREIGAAIAAQEQEAGWGGKSRGDLIERSGK